MERIFTKEEGRQNMNEETIQFFLRGLKVAIKQSGLTQKDFAEGITSEVNLSNILRGETGTSAKMREALARKAGLDTEDIVLIGQQIQQKESPPRNIPGVETGYVNPMDVLAAVSTASTAVSTLVGQYLDTKDRMQFWRAIVDEMPISAIVIKDGIVIYQNVQSASWGTITGGSLCDSCACPEDCKDQQNCPIHIAMETRNPVSGYQHIGAEYYKVNIKPLRLHDHEYFIIVAMEERHEGGDRRTGGDRRRETIGNG